MAVALWSTSIVLAQVDQGKAITTILSERLTARLNSMRMVIDNGRIVSAHLHTRLYLMRLQSIDTAGCPQEFRLAWLDYIQTWERKLSGRRAAEDVLEALPALSGDFRDLGDIGKRMAASDTSEAWRHCERVALEFGVDASKVRER